MKLVDQGVLSIALPSAVSAAPCWPWVELPTAEPWTPSYILAFTAACRQSSVDSFTSSRHRLIGKGVDRKRGVMASISQQPSRHFPLSLFLLILPFIFFFFPPFYPFPLLPSCPEAAAPVNTSEGVWSTISSPSGECRKALANIDSGIQSKR